MSDRGTTVGRPSPAALLQGGDTPSSAVRLTCIHHAGGAASAYAAWSKAMPDTVALYRVQLPGREGRFSEPFEECLVNAADAVAQALHRLDGNKPLVLFGHSMGAVIAFHAARRLATLGDFRLRTLVVSGCVAASRLEAQVARRGALHTLDDRALALAVAAYGGLPSFVTESPELMEALMPIFRADFRLVDTYAYRAAPPLDVPVHAFYGDRDEHADPDDVLAWGAETTAGFRSTRFEGGHFFLRERADAVHAALVRELESARQIPPMPRTDNSADGSAQLP